MFSAISLATGLPFFVDRYCSAACVTLVLPSHASGLYYMFIILLDMVFTLRTLFVSDERCAGNCGRYCWALPCCFFKAAPFCVPPLIAIRPTAVLLLGLVGLIQRLYSRCCMFWCYLPFYLPTTIADGLSVRWVPVPPPGRLTAGFHLQRVFRHATLYLFSVVRSLLVRMQPVAVRGHAGCMQDTSRLPPERVAGYPPLLVFCLTLRLLPMLPAG
jgi:hypothetical protein